jgi:RNA polymerase sigma-70 factor, ECF subfamily
MSALPTAFAIPPSAPVKSAVSNRNKRGAPSVSCSSDGQHGLRIVPSVKNSLPDFTSLFHTYRRRIYAQCFYMLQNHVDAEDVSQEVFLQLLRKAHTFRGESSFSTWLHRLTTNCVLMEMRRKRRRCVEVSTRETSTGTGENGNGDDPLDSYPAPAVPLFEQVTLRTAISQLPVGYQRIFELHDVEGHTHEEIAALLGIQDGTSKSQLHKARVRMRGLLQDGKAATRNSKRQCTRRK